MDTPGSKHWVGLNESYPFPRTTSVAEIQNLIKEQYQSLSERDNFEYARTSKADLKAIKSKKVKKYYEGLNQQVSAREALQSLVDSLSSLTYQLDYFREVE